jgi:hypothetical protein
LPLERRPHFVSVAVDKDALPPTVEIDVDDTTLPPHALVRVVWLCGPLAVLQPSIARRLGQRLIEMADRAERGDQPARGAAQATD